MKACLSLFSYGGVLGPTVDALIHEIASMTMHGKEVNLIRIKDDALVSRSRSVTASRFLTETDSDVLFMIDHDIGWRIGDIERTCQIALEKKSLVAGLYACRAFGYGVSSRLEKEQTVNIGEAQLIPAKYLAAGFLAIPRVCLQKIIDADNDIVQTFKVGEYGPYYDFFRPVVYEEEYLSEDWSMSLRANQAGVANYIFTAPVLRHYGHYGFLVPDGTEHKRDTAV